MAKRKKKKQPKISFLSSIKNDLSKRSPVFLFCVGLVVIMLVYYWIYNLDFFTDNINYPIIKAYAHAGSGVLNVFGMGTETETTFISNADFKLNIGKGCDAFSPMILFMAAVLAFPVAFKWKAPALVIAPIAIILLNIIRIASLFLIGIHWPGVFEIFHVEIWQSLFIIFCLAGWFFWLAWTQQKMNKLNIEG